MQIKRGDILLVNLEPTKGSEQGLKRPAVVIQNNTGNKYSPTTIVAPVTSSCQQQYPTTVKLSSSSKTGLKKDSAVLLNQIRTVSVEHRVVKRLGEVPKKKMWRVDEAIKTSLALD